jgi:hypothetical protein
MRPIRVLVAGLIIVGVPILTASAAHATVKGPCSASATIDGTSYDARRATVVIPHKGTVNWRGAIGSTRGRRDIEGKVKLKLPPPCGGIVIAGGDWDGLSSSTRNQGRYEYDLPKWFAGGRFTVSGHHAEGGAVVCDGSIDIEIAGSKLKNPILLGSIVLTVLAVVNMGFVIRAKEALP